MAAFRQISREILPCRKNASRLTALPLLLTLAGAAHAEITREYLPDIELRDSTLLRPMAADAKSMVIEVRGSLPDDKDGFTPSGQCWDVVWDADSALTSGSFVSLSSFRSNYGDATDTQGLRVITGSLSEPDAAVTTDILKGVNETAGPNTVIIELTDTTARLFAGNTRLTSIGTFRRGEPGGALWGIRCNARWRSSLIVTETEPDPATPLLTAWTPKKLDEHLSTSKDPAEGRWLHFDRTNDPAKGRPGGNYLLATVSDGDGGYHILYLDGAKVWASRWQPFMLKGHLSPTRFPGEYDLTWHDSTMKPLTTARDECSATLTPDTLLEVRFPLNATTLRFAPLP